MQILASRQVRERIIASSDQGAAADMMLVPASGYSTKVLGDDLKLVWDGRVAPLLLWDKHPQAVLLAGLIGLILLAWLTRLFRPRRMSGAPASGT
jgi:hypothetical protein